MYALLAILLSFCPQKVEEEIVSVLRDNYADKMASLARGFEFSIRIKQPHT